MSKVMAGALGVGLCCFFWVFFCHYTGVISWMGFVGCTSYFAAGGGKMGALKAICSNYTGIAWAMFVILAGGMGLLGSEGSMTALMLGALATGFIAWGMCFQGHVAFLAIVPCTFMGCFSTFGSGGDWQNMLIGVTAGVGLGLSCTLATDIFFKMFGKEEQPDALKEGEQA